jgi:outer membrane protein
MKKVWIIVFGLGYLGLSAQKKWSLKECVSYAVEHNLQVIQNQYNKQSQEYSLRIAKKGSYHLFQEAWEYGEFRTDVFRYGKFKK